MTKLLNSTLGFRLWMMNILAVSVVSFNWHQIEKRLESNLINYYFYKDQK